MRFPIVALTLFCLCPAPLWAHDSGYVARPVPPPDGRWSPYRASLRLGVGAQKAFFTELGLARHQYVYSGPGSASLCQYASLEWTPGRRGRHAVYGIKAGAEASVSVVAVGFEAKYATDTRVSDVLLTPRAGLGFLGMVNLYYGYSFSLRDRPFPGVGGSQFSLVYVFHPSPAKRGGTASAR